jgi:hypothetical protein
MFEKGDIVINYKPIGSIKAFFSHFVQWAIRFFTTDFYTGERFSKAHHVEMVYEPGDLNTTKDISEEPPYVQLCSFSKSSQVYRLVDKPQLFNYEFDKYAMSTLKYKVKYDFGKILAFIGDWLFRTVKFTEWFGSKRKNVCSSYVAKFYEERVKVPCSRKDWMSTDPDSVYDYVGSHPNKFKLIYKGF